MNAQTSLFGAHDMAVPGEPTFTLLARDTGAPAAVRQWAYMRERDIHTGIAPESDHPKIASARKLAVDMENWRRDNPGAWRDPQAQVA